MMGEGRLVKRVPLKPLLFRGGVGVGPIGFRQRGLSGTRPTPLRLGSKLPSLTAPPLKRRGEARPPHPNFSNFTPVTDGNSWLFPCPDTQKPRLRRGFCVSGAGVGEGDAENSSGRVRQRHGGECGRARGCRKGFGQLRRPRCAPFPPIDAAIYKMVSLIRHETVLVRRGLPKTVAAPVQVDLNRQASRRNLKE